MSKAATKRISGLLDLERAYNQMIDDERRGDDFIPDVIHFLDSKPHKDKILQDLKEKIDGGRYQAGPLVKMDVPKDNFFIRPGSRPSQEDWLLYEALANRIGSKADKRLESTVFSCRLDDRDQPVFWLGQWEKFEAAFWERFEEGFNYVVKADITSYFANINIELLRESILALIADEEDSEELIDLLFNSLLRPWSQREVRKGFGLPQGIDASRVLANLFLWRIDARFSGDERFRYLRYQDDMRILAKTSVEARIALIEMVKALRDIGLDLNEKKTDILDRPQVEQELRDPRRKELGIIDKALKKGNKTTLRQMTLPLLQVLFEGSFDFTNPFGGRHLRFCLHRFVRLRENLASEEQLITRIGSKLSERLETMPGSAKLFAQFFGVFPRDMFKNQLLEFLKSGNNIYCSQEMWILDSLLRFSSFSSNELEVFRRIGFDRNKHILCRSKAILLLGKFGDEYERYELRRKFGEEADPIVKRAIVIATQQLSVATRNEFYSSIKKTDHQLTSLIDYLRSLSQPLYYDDYIPPTISITDGEY